MSPEQRAALPSSMDRASRSISHDEVRQLAEAPLQQLLIPFVQAEVAILMAMSLCILCTDDELGFITSDAPFVLFDPMGYKRPAFYRAPAFGYQTVEATLPLGPDKMALFTHSSLTGYHSLRESEAVDDLNRKTRFGCDEYFVARRNETRPIWFERGTPPADAKDV